MCLGSIFVFKSRFRISWPWAHPEAAVVLHHRVGEVDPLAAPHELPHLGVVVQADVVAHEVTVQAVPPALLLVQEDVRG